MRILFLLSILLFLPSCRYKTSAEQTLVAAEALMEERPDSALVLLEGLDTARLAPGYEKALYGLLQIQAADKNYLLSKDENRITAAADYFRREKDKRHAMLACYYQAQVRLNNNNHARSIVSLLHAEKMAAELQDDFYLALIYRMMYDIYTHIDGGKDALHYAKQAHKHFVMAHKPLHARYGLADIACSYHNLQQYDRSIPLLLEVTDSAVAHKDTALLTFVTELISASYLGNRQYTKAQNSLLCLKKLLNNNLEADDIRNLGVAYFHTGQMDSAEYYMRLLREKDSTEQLLPYLIYQRKGMYKEALKALEQETGDIDSIYVLARKQGITPLVAEFRLQEKDYYAREITREKQIKILLSVLFAVILLLVITIYRLHIKAKKQEMAHCLIQAEHLKELLELLETEHKDAKQHIDQLFKNSFSTINDLCRNYYECHGTGNERAKIHKHVMEIITKLEVSDKNSKFLENYVDTYKDRLMAHFKSDYPAMSPIDYSLFIYLVIGLSPQTISILSKEKVEVIYNRKHRLKEKIRRNPCPKQDIYLKNIS